MRIESFTLPVQLLTQVTVKDSGKLHFVPLELGNTHFSTSAAFVAYVCAAIPDLEPINDSRFFYSLPSIKGGAKTR